MLTDEPTGSIDPPATERVEALMLDPRADHSVVGITHSVMQARRVADRVACFHLGRLMELAPAAECFADPVTPEARAFVAGRTG
jgi:phosphate transport system ATP-binding protein